jgi:uncharacterized protein YbjT (DUF2867 family)
MTIVVIGGSGRIGSKLFESLRGEGHDVIAASPATGVNAITGEGLAAALKRASVVVDVSNAPSLEDGAVMEFFKASGRNLLAAEAAAGIGPEAAPLDQFARRLLTAAGDTRRVIADGHARYFGAELNDQSLTPGESPVLGATRFEDWLARTVRA